MNKSGHTYGLNNRSSVTLALLFKSLLALWCASALIFSMVPVAWADEVESDIAFEEEAEGVEEQVVGEALNTESQVAEEADVDMATPSVAAEAETAYASADASQTTETTTPEDQVGTASADTANASAASLPTSYDARSNQLISPVRLQDPWGTCWAFASLSAMEANLVKQGLASSQVQLSPRHLIYFAGTPVGENAGSQAGEGINPIDELVALYGENAVFALGGHALEVASTISSGEGVVLEAAYPYKNNEEYIAATDLSYAAEGTWSLDESARFESAYTLRNMQRLSETATFTEPGNIETYALNYYALDAVKQAILDYGAVSASYCSYHGEAGHANYYNAENATFFTNDTTAIDHDICIVGWDDSFSRYNFTTGKDGAYPEDNGAWIVKNSWGAASEEFPNRNAWGEEGYFYLSYYDRSVQGFTAWEMMPASGPEATEVTYQYDYMGQRSNSETRVTSYNPQAYANVFTATGNQLLQAVSVNTYAPNTEVVVRLYAVDENASGENFNPQDGTLLTTQTLTCDWGGYHRIQLNEAQYVEEGQRFAVVVSTYEIDENGNRIAVASIEAGNNIEMIKRYKLDHYDTVVVNPGESFVFATINNQLAWVDASLYATLLHDLANDNAYFGNACIKVFANPYTPQPSPAPSPSPSENQGQQDTAAADANTNHAMPSQQVVGATATATAAVAAPVEQAAPGTAHALAATGDVAPGLVFFLVAILLFSVFGLRRSCA